MTDRRFPNRPDHPDFWLISEAILDMDAQADAGAGSEAIIGRMIDSESVGYAATQRGLIAEPMWRGKRVSPLILGASWMDGFLAGMMVQQKMAARDARPGPADITPEDIIGPGSG